MDELLNPLNKLSNIEAEQCLLGTIILMNNQFYVVSEELQAEHFYVEQHQKIYNHIANILGNGTQANQITLLSFFENSIEGGKKYLSILLGNASGVFNAKDISKEIIDLWKRRQLVIGLNEIIRETYTIDKNIAVLSNKLNSINDEISLSESDKPKHILHAFNEKFEDLINKTNDEIISTGYNGLDEKIGGFNKGYLVILAGRPSMGKSTFSLCLANQIAKNEAVCFFSLEMSSKQIVSKIIGNVADIHLSRIKHNNLSDKDFDNIEKSREDIAQLKFYLDYPRQALTLQALRAKIKLQVLQNNVKVVFIDHLGKLKLGGKSWSKNDEVSQITNTLKDIAVELGIVIVVLSQLSRAVEQRLDKRPQLSDLRDSGSIEQDADIVMFCYRAEYYLERAKPNKYTEPELYNQWCEKLNEVKGLTEIIIAKAREGEPQTALFNFEAGFARFIEMQE